MKAPAGYEVDFFWTVVHELRQPLSVISGEVQIAKRVFTSDPSRATKALERSLAQIARIDRILEELHARAARRPQHTRRSSGPRARRVPGVSASSLCECLADRCDHETSSRTAFTSSSASNGLGSVSAAPIARAMSRACGRPLTTTKGVGRPAR